jgi:hypothetical protein
LPTHIHFVCPCMQSLIHLPCEVVCIGPPICSSQWMLECTIGNLGKEIKQHSNPFANLSQHGIRHAWVNAFVAMIPDLEGHKSSKRSHGSKDLNCGHILLCAQDADPHCLQECEADTLRQFLPTISRMTSISIC